MHRRWKVACSLKPQFPAPQISYLSENVGQADVVLRDPATIHLQHAAVPPGVQYIVKYYAGAFNPDHFRSETKVPTFAEGCSYEFTYNKQKYHFPVLIISMTVEFDADQAFTTMTTREEWAIKMTHSPPDATDVFLKTATIDSTTHKFQAITISCRNDECGGAGAPKCRVTYRRFRTIDSAPGDAEICDEAGPCDVNVQDPQYNVLLMRVQARCENVEDEWIPSSWVWFEMPIQTTAPPNPISPPTNKWGWRQIVAEPSPPARSKGKMATAKGIAVLFGGVGTSGVLGDTWEYSFVDQMWTEVVASPTPAARSHHDMTSYGESDKVFLYGGGTGFGFTPGSCDNQRFDDIWTYSVSTKQWSQLPKPTFAACHAWKTVMRQGVVTSWKDTILLFSPRVEDHGATCIDDTWLYNVSSQSWTSMASTLADCDGWGYISGYVQMVTVGHTAVAFGSYDHTQVLPCLGGVCAAYEFDL